MREKFLVASLCRDDGRGRCQAKYLRGRGASGNATGLTEEELLVRLSNGDAFDALGVSPVAVSVIVKKTGTKTA